MLKRLTKDLLAVVIPFYWGAVVVGLLVACAGCAAVPRLLSPDQKVSAGGDATVSSSIGGGGDSLALWLAILGLIMAALAYPVGHLIRKKWFPSC